MYDNDLGEEGSYAETIGNIGKFVNHTWNEYAKVVSEHEHEGNYLKAKVQHIGG